MKKIYLTFIVTFLLTQISISQNLNGVITQDQKVSNLLSEKRKLNSKITINDTYKIQIYHGSSEGSKKALNDFKGYFKDIDATIIFTTPNYKVWVGSYKSKIEATKARNEFKKYFERSLIIKPNK